MSNWINVCLSVFLCVISLQARSQTEFINFNVENGLPSNETYEVFQDSKGYIWFATDHGVVKYNGNEFTILTTNDGLPDNTILRFYEDQYARIWFLTLNGNIGYYQNDSIYQLSLPKSYDIRFTLGISVDKNDVVKIKFRSPTSSVQFTLREDQHEIKENELSHNEHHCNLLNYSLDEHFGHKCPENSETTDIISKTGKLLFYHQLFDSLVLYRDPTFSTKTIQFGNRITQEIASYDYLNEFPLQVTGSGTYNGYFYVCYQNGDLVLFDKEGSIREVQHFNDFIPTSIIDDQQGGVWVSTLNKGILYKPNKNIEIIKFDQQISSNGLAKYQTSGKVSLISNFKNELYGFDEGLAEISPEIKERFVAEIKSVKYLNQSFFVASDKYLYVYDDEGHQIKIHNGTNKLVPLPDKVRNITYGDFLVYHDTIVSCSRQFVSFDDRTLQSMEAKRFQTMVSMDDTIWVGANNGLFAVSKSREEFIALDSSIRVKDRILDLEISKEGILFFATRGKGVGVKVGNSIHNIKKVDGLASNSINKMLLDSTNNLWVSTNSGISKISFSSFQPLEFEVHKFGKEDGIYDQKINDMQLFNDTVHILTDFALYKLPKNYEKKKRSTLLKLSAVYMNDSIKIARNSTIPSDHKNIKFVFETIYFPNPESVSLQYSYDNGASWSSSSSRIIDFPNQKYGDYNMKFRALNAEGMYSNVIDFNFTIRAPVWYRWWFIALEILLVLIVFKGIYAYLLRQNRIKSRMLEAELKALRSQMNPHFTFNSMNSIQSYVLDNKSEEAVDFIAKYSDLVRTILNNSRNELVSLEEELHVLKLYMDIEKSRLKNDLSYVVDIHDDVDPEMIHIPSMILQPYVENAIWHGLSNANYKGEISLQFQMENNSLKCVIEDNGIGREKAQALKGERKSKHKSWGMSISKERLDLINSRTKKKMSVKIIDLFSDNQRSKPAGTRVEIFVHLLER